jgi:DHA2 family multidrug resistance protein
VAFLQRAKAGMMAAGADSYTATQRAIALLDGDVTRQAAVLAYNHIFVLVTVLFMMGVPLVLLLRRGHAPEPGEGVHVD